MAYFEVKKLPPISTPSLTGSIVTFNSQYAGLPLKSHKIALPHSLSGYSAINISHSDADTSNPTVYTIQIGSTVYGGEYDAKTGIYSGAYNKIVLNGTQALRTTNWNPKTNSIGWIYQWSVTQNARSDASVAATILTDNPNINAIPYNTIQNQDVEGISVYTSTGWFGLILRIADTSLTDATAINNYMSQNPLTVVFPLETPTTIQLPPCPIDTLQGVNNIWADTGDTTLQYIKLG